MIAAKSRMFLLLSLLGYGCVEPYDPPLSNDDLNLLVVDGFLNATDDRAAVSITRTLPVKNADPVPAESGALVAIEDDQGMQFVLTETSPGHYEGDVPGAGPNLRYRLLIHTAGNRAYASDFVSVLQTPPIDSISYTVDRNGVQFEANTHDPTNAARNFRWKFEETYEYRAAYNSLYIFEGNEPVSRPPDQSIFTCWRTNPSTDIIIGSTKHLTGSIVSRTPVVFLPKESIKISVEYSLLLRQQALTDEAYNYWLDVERTTEHLGGLFDPLPSEVRGNVHNTNDPSETVIGYFDAGTVQEQRIFVRRTQLPHDLIGVYRRDGICELDTIPVFELSQMYTPTTYLVDAVYGSGPFIIAYTSTLRACADCTEYGGTTVKPPFWE